MFLIFIYYNTKNIYATLSAGIRVLNKLAWISVPFKQMYAHLLYNVWGPVGFRSPRCAALHLKKRERERKGSVYKLALGMIATLLLQPALWKNDRDLWLIRICGAPFCCVLFSHSVPAEAGNDTSILEHFCCYISSLYGRRPEQ